jgi:hypothetical protein
MEYVSVVIHFNGSQYIGKAQQYDNVNIFGLAGGYLNPNRNTKTQNRE